MVEAGLLAGLEVEASVREALAPLLGQRDAAGEFVFPLPPSAKIDTLLLGCTHYPLLLPVISKVAGEGIAIVDSASATASALAELLSINGLEAPAGGATGSGGSHLQLTTGDVEAFRSIAERMFGEAFPDVVGVELGSARAAAAAAGAAAATPAAGAGKTA
jgi:glutamate racemase